MTTATTEIKTMIVVVYAIGLFSYSGLISIFFNLILKRRVTFTTVLFHCFVGALVGTLVAIAIFNVLEPTDIVYGQPDWEEKMDFQVGLANFCTLFPIGTIFIAGIYSTWTQFKNKAVTSE